MKTDSENPEERVKCLISEIAKRNGYKVDFSRKFFSSGQFNSIIAVELVIRIEKEFGKMMEGRTFQNISELDDIQSICSKINHSK